MVRARAAILERGGAARANVFTRIALALFGAAALARRALYSRRDHAAAAMVPVSSRQGVVLVAHRDGAAVHSVHAQADGQESAQRRHPRAVHDAAGEGAALLPRPRTALARAGIPAVRPARPHDRSADSQGHARARDAPRRAVDARAAERRGRPRRHLSRHGQCAGSDGDPGLSGRRPAARHRQARIAEAAGGRPLERLLPALRFAGLGYRACRASRCRKPATQPRSQAATRALDWLQDRAAAR